MKEGCEICRPRSFVATGGHLVWLCYSTGLVSYFIASMVKETQFEMLIDIAVTFNTLSSDSCVLYVYWCYIIAAGFLSA
jgi:hypothetical protein